ncbi:hypothetical protein BC831DRAFT_466383, partial [Entophlyctis helioformis]
RCDARVADEVGGKELDDCGNGRLAANRDAASGSRGVADETHAEQGDKCNKCKHAWKGLGHTQIAPLRVACRAVAVTCCSLPPKPLLPKPLLSKRACVRACLPATRPLARRSADQITRHEAALLTRKKRRRRILWPCQLAVWHLPGQWASGQPIPPRLLSPTDESIQRACHRQQPAPAKRRRSTSHARGTNHRLAWWATNQPARPLARPQQLPPIAVRPTQREHDGCCPCCCCCLCCSTLR